MTEDISSSRKPRIGLALSGGGSRAIAFHLGCMKVLHEKGILEQADIISGVSGGSVIAAIYAYGDGSFEEFEEEIIDLLHKGLFKSILAEYLRPANLAKCLFAFVFTVIPGILLDALHFILPLLYEICNIKKPSKTKPSSKAKDPPVRFFNRTGAFEKALDRKLFPGTMMTAKRRRDMSIVINATELTTGTAFRFGNTKSGSWRSGMIRDNDVRVAHAVAASAAYPLVLPSFDGKYDFIDKQGHSRKKRIILSDGGIVDNLGISCFDPSVQEEFSTNIFHPDFIISCDAGAGQSSGNAKPTWLGPRMSQAFLASYRKLQDAKKNDLFQWKESGRISGVILAMLGQQDDALAGKFETSTLPPDFVTRDEVKDYPTNFSAMSSHDIALLAGRGRCLMELMVKRYFKTRQ